MLRLHSRLSVWGKLAAGLAPVFMLSVSALAASGDKPAITKPGYDPKAPRVEMFEGIKQKALDVRMIPKDETGGNLLIENLSDETITVELPEAVVGVQVLAQEFGGDLGGSGGDEGGGGGGGQQQAVGGGQQGGIGGGQQGGGGFGGGGGGGFFSIPSGRTVRMPYHSVCLEHGKKEPNPRSQYKVIPVEEYTDNAQLQQLIKLVAANKLDQQSAQAAAWHLSSDMSWEQLASKTYDRVRAPDSPYFSHAQLVAAQQIVAVAKQRVEESGQAAEQPAQPRVRGRVPLTN